MWVIGLSFILFFWCFRLHCCLFFLFLNEGFNFIRIGFYVWCTKSWKIIFRPQLLSSTKFASASKAQNKWEEVLHPNFDIDHLDISKSVQFFNQLKSLLAYNINYHWLNEDAYYTLSCNKYFLHCNPGHVK